MLKPTIFMSGLTALAIFIYPMDIKADSYPINFPISTTIGTSRALNSIKLTSPSDGAQTVTVGQASDRLLYHDLTDKCFSATIGESVNAAFDWSGAWMHGYVYLDRGNDGSFEYELGTNSSIPEGSDVMAFSNYEAYNSVGEYTNNGNVGVNPPAFTIPSDLTPGLYRMRYKVDWNSIDPGGNTASDNLITANCGAISDVLIYLHNQEGHVTVNADHGTVTTDNGAQLHGQIITTGQDLHINILPDENYQIASVKIESGYDIGNSNVSFASSNLIKKSTDIPASLIQNNELTIPGEYTYGSVVLSVTFTEEGNEPEEGNYESSITGNKDANSGITAITLSAGSASKTLTISTTERHYFYDTEALPVLKGQEITPDITYSGTAQDLRLYIDSNHNGVFSAATGELLTSAANGSDMPSFTLSQLIPAGVYRCRVEADNDCVVDFLLNLHEAQGNIIVDVNNGYALSSSMRPLNGTVAFGGSLTILPQATLQGFEADNATVRHGHNLYGPQYVKGNRQWSEITIPTGETTTIDPADVDGDILIMADFAEADDSEWTRIWGDEFDGDDLDTSKWSYHPRRSSTWNRLIATGDEIPLVNKFEDGHYKSYCIATPDEFTDDDQPMISGAIFSNQKFYMVGGKIEARIKTRPHTGNFPAFWMMPEDQSAGWPKCGEIDIWEQIDTENKSYHTIHSAWTYKSFGTVSRNSPTSSGSYNSNSAIWHVYSFEWDQNSLKWYVDNRPIFTYSNSHFSEGDYTEDMTWPFAKAFYVILNQSVGNGSWAQNCDPTFEYLTEFDYVRAYQKKDALNYHSEAAGIDEIITDNDIDDTDAPVYYYNLQGMRIDASNLTKGIYIRKQGSKVTKIAIY